ncbi:MAG: hypothetical protein JO000_13930 [Alphaproteobacteria bacterium]|nr:hypothetical protein [Alphaproteobacteria bacterium]
MTSPTRRSVLHAAAALLIVSASPALAQQKDKAMTSLFKIVSVKDEVVIGLSPDELSGLGGNDAGAVAKALAAKGTLTVWQYAVRKAQNGDLEQAPLRKIGLIAHDSLRVEPVATPLKVIAHE